MNRKIVTRSNKYPSAIGPVGCLVRRIGSAEGAGMAAVALIAGLLAILATAGCGGGSAVNNNTNMGPVAASVSATIPVGTAPWGITVDSTNNKIYVADSGTTPSSSQACTPTGADVMVIDGAAQPATASLVLSLPNVTPYPLAFNSTTHTVDVAAFEYGADITKGCRNTFDDVLSIDPSNPSAAGLLYHAGIGAGHPGLATVGDIAVDESSGDIYLGQGFSGDGGGLSNIAVLDDTGAPKAGIPVGTLPLGIAVNPSPNVSAVYAGTSNIYGFQGPNLLIIDKATEAVTAMMPFPTAGWIKVAVNPATSTIYAANWGSNNVSVVDAATTTVTATIPVGKSPNGIAVNPQTNFIYVANSGDGSITVIDGKTNATSTLRDPNAAFPFGVAVNPVTNKIYVTNNRSNNVTVIDGAHD